MKLHFEPRKEFLLQDPMADWLVVDSASVGVAGADPPKPRPLATLTTSIDGLIGSSAAESPPPLSGRTLPDAFTLLLPAGTYIHTHTHTQPHDRTAKTCRECFKNQSNKKQKKKKKVKHLHRIRTNSHTHPHQVLTFRLSALATKAALNRNHIIPKNFLKKKKSLEEREKKKLNSNEGKEKSCRTRDKVTIHLSNANFLDHKYLTVLTSNYKINDDNYWPNGFFFFLLNCFSCLPCHLPKDPENPFRTVW